MFFFQHWLADMVVAADDLALIDTIWRDWSPGYDGTDDLAAVKDSLRDPANLAAAIGYYRAALNGVGVRDDLAAVQETTGSIPSHRPCTCTAPTTGASEPRSPSPRGMTSGRTSRSRSSRASATSSISSRPT